jgi:hypothetical protein
MKKNLLLILVVTVIIFVFNYNKNCSTENFSNVCWSLQSSYTKDILNQNKNLITSYGLNNHINKIIEPLVKPNIIDKKLTLEKYFSNIKIPSNKIDQATILIKNIVNNNSLISTLDEFDIKKTNLLFDIATIWNMNNLINSMLCVIDDKKVIDNLIRQLLLVIISPRIEFCSKDNFQKYCQVSYQNYIKEITPKVKVKVVAVAKSVSPKVRSAVRSVSPKVRSAVRSVSPKVRLAVRSVSPKVRSAVRSVSPKVRSAVRSVSPKVRSAAKSVSSKVRSAVRSVSPKVRSAAKSVSSKVRSAVRSVSPKVRSAAKSVSSKVRSAVRSVSPKVRSAAKSVSSKVRSAAKSVSPKVRSAIRSVSPKVRSVSQRVKSAAKSVSSKIRSTANKIISKVKVTNKKELETFTQKLDKTVKKIRTGSIKLFNSGPKVSSLLLKPIKYMDIYSLSEYLKNFNVKSFGSILEKNMMILMTKFKKNNNTDFNIFIKKDFGKLVGILVGDIKMVVNKIVDEDDFSKLKPFVNEFNNLQKIFYLLKHNYRLLLTYELINNKIKNDDEKLQAQLCCSKTSEKSCFNFSANPKNSSALLYGFDELGYVKNVKCIKENEASKVLHREQNMRIDELFNNKYAAWRNLSNENKSKIYSNLINLLKIFGINLNRWDINDKIINIRLKLEKQKYKLNMSDFELKKIPYKLGNIHLKFKVNNNNYNNMVNRIKTSDNVDKLNEILKLLGYSKDHIIFNNNVELTYAKNITETLVFINEVFKNFESNNPIAVGKLFGIIKTPESFSQIMRNTTILHRYHQTVVDFVIKIITDKKFAIIRSYTMNSLPETTIKYLQSKPSSSDLNFCNVHEEFLLQLRKDRSITNDEFNKYLQQSYLYCNPNKVNIKDMKSITIPKSIKKGLSIVERKYKSYNEFVKEKKNLVKDKLESKVISDNILFNTLKNTYN